MSESPPERKPARLRRALRTSVVLGILVCVLLGAGRLYLSDDRLKTILETQATERLGQAINIAELELSLFGGLKIYNLSMGVKEKDDFALQAELIAIDWLWSRQSMEHVGLEHFSIRGLQVYQNLPAPAQPAPLPQLPAKPAAKTQAFVFPPIPLQEWPLLVGVEHIHIQLKELHFLKGENEVKLQGIQLSGSITLGAGLAGANFTLETQEESAHLLVRTPSLIQINDAPKLSINLATEQDSKITLSAMAQIPAYEQVIRFQNETSLNIPRGNLSTSLFQLSIGEHSHLQTSASLNSIYTKPNLETGELLIEANFDSLKPLFDLFELPAEMSGEVVVGLKPVKLDSLVPAALNTISLEGLVQAKNVFVKADQNHLQGFNGDVAINYQDGRIHADSKSLTLSFQSPAVSLKHSKFEFSVNTLVDDWLLRDAQDTTALILKGSLRSLASSGANIEKVEFNLQSSGPTAILRKQTSATAFTYSLDLETLGIRQNNTSLGALSAQAHGSFYDTRGESLETTLDVQSTQIKLNPIDGPFAVDKVSANAHVRKRQKTIEFTDSRLRIDELVDVDLNGALTLHSSKLITASKLKLTAHLKDLAALKNSLPPNPSLPKSVSGSAELSINLTGTVPVEKLLAQAAPPPVPEFVNPEQWESDAKPLVDYVGTWMRSLSEGLDLESLVVAKLTDIDLSHQDQTITGFSLNSTVDTSRASPSDPTHTHTVLKWGVKKVQGKAAVGDARGLIDLEFINDEVILQNTISIDSLAHPSLVSALHHISVEQKATYRFGKELDVEKSTFSANGEDLKVSFQGLIHHPIRTVTSGALLQESLPGVTAHLKSRISLKSSQPTLLLAQAPTLQGQVAVTTDISIENGALSFQGDMKCKALSLADPTMLISNVSGNIPVRAVFESYNTAQNMSILRDLGFAGGALYLRTDGIGENEDGQRQVYYEDLRPYRPQVGIEIGRVKFGDYELNSLTLDARIENGTLSADHFSTELLGGDILGNLRLGLNSARELKGSFAVQASNIDASNFSKLNLEPGPDSELSADMRLGIFVSPTQRDINLDVNVTQIGKTTLDRFLQLLDPEDKNPQIQKTRRSLKIIKIHEVTAWIRHENLNMDLDYTTLLSIPGTDIGFRPIDRELLRRYTLTEQVIDPYFQSYVDRYLSKSLGWNHATP